VSVGSRAAFGGTGRKSALHEPRLSADCRRNYDDGSGGGGGGGSTAVGTENADGDDGDMTLFTERRLVFRVTASAARRRRRHTREYNIFFFILHTSARYDII